LKLNKKPVDYTDEQIKEMMKGKSAAERKRFLQEIEQERQK